MGVGGGQGRGRLGTSGDRPFTGRRGGGEGLCLEERSVGATGRVMLGETTVLFYKDDLSPSFI